MILWLIILLFWFLTLLRSYRRTGGSLDCCISAMFFAMPMPIKRLTEKIASILTITTNTSFSLEFFKDKSVIKIKKLL